METIIAPEYTITHANELGWFVVVDPIWAAHVQCPKVLGPFPSSRTARDAVELFRQ